jgi:hypothetical protein
MSKSFTLNSDAIFFFFDVGRVKVNMEFDDLLEISAARTVTRLHSF